MWTRASVSRVVLTWLLCYISLFSPAWGIPLFRTPNPPSSIIQPRDRYILSNNTITGIIQAINPVTLQLVPQGLATDGSGNGFNLPAVIWVVFVLLVGLPLSFAGFRCWRMTTGVGIGLAAAVVSWASFINTVNAEGISDIFLALLVLGFFAAGFLLGCFEIGKLAGMVSLGITGGISFGVRLMLLRPGLLIPAGGDGEGAGYVLGWMMIALLGVTGGLWVALSKFRRSGLLFSCTAAGTSLVALGVDLILNKQTGMSRGLIFLFDRNPSHIVDIITKGYEPSITTQVILGSSLVLIPILSFAQHRLFKAPFDRGKLYSDRASVLDSDFGDAPSVSTPSQGGIFARHRQNASAMFSGLWDSGLLRSGRSPNRFSV